MRPRGGGGGNRRGGARPGRPRQPPPSPRARAQRRPASPRVRQGRLALGAAPHRSNFAHPRAPAARHRRAPPAPAAGRRAAGVAWRSSALPPPGCPAANRCNLHARERCASGTIERGGLEGGYGQTGWAGVASSATPRATGDSESDGAPSPDPGGRKPDGALLRTGRAGVAAEGRNCDSDRYCHADQACAPGRRRRKALKGKHHVKQSGARQDTLADDWTADKRQLSRP